MNGLAKEGYKVIALGRSKKNTPYHNKNVSWLIKDITKISAENWLDLLKDIDLVVNAAGALQSNPQDNLHAIHIELVQKLSDTSRQLNFRFVQISASGVVPNASTDFMTTKATAEEYIKANARNWVILRPSLVLSPSAFGGTALLRGAAALPLFMPLIFKDKTVQTVHIDDLVRAVVIAGSDNVASGTVGEISEIETQSFPQLIEAIRGWLMIEPTNRRVPVPNWAMSLSAKLADFASHLGWRTALRSTSLKVLEDGIHANSTPWTEATGQSFRPLSQSLADLPSTIQERRYSKLFFLLPLAVICLSFFWVYSGVVGLIFWQDSQQVLTSRGMHNGAALAIVCLGGLLDMILGVVILFRRYCRFAAVSMMILAICYLTGSLFIAGDLWLDPLGPMIKVLPGIVLALYVAISLDER